MTNPVQLGFCRHCREATAHRDSQQIRFIAIRHYPDGVTGNADQWADDDTDFRLALPGVRESLIEAEADYRAGRTFSEGHIRAHYGLLPRHADQDELCLRCTAHGNWMSDHPDAVAAADEWADGNLDELHHT
ncbi:MULTISPECIES: hypothetical protein [Mycobacterium]|uniref:hypothetical protein n=1 Tax=Mycobacterium TaxID=1763 RepID=UPI001E57B711|nr:MULTISPECIES: hypothetical protein [Mycobacterium]WSE53616.1 hypothetical protein QGN31_11610 [Mycobacterium sp. 2-64]